MRLCTDLIISDSNLGLYICFIYDINLLCVLSVLWGMTFQDVESTTI